MGQDGVFGTGFVSGSAPWPVCSQSLCIYPRSNNLLVRVEQAHVNSSTSFLHKHRGILQPAAHKHNAGNSRNATEAAPVYAWPALLSGRSCLKQQSWALRSCGLGLDLQTGQEQRECRTVCNSSEGSRCRIATYLHLPQHLVPSTTATTRTQGMGKWDGKQTEAPTAPSSTQGYGSATKS